ncbi:rod shape-determining protein MreC [Tenuibacillus multivorans]|uniref:Cell shape-determining protein MreC n=1 Tax=Tenuibacillus multivorans TaxID=237069 RepID=A0A1G9ZL61_9BACI|nr:rod shape-determining protein MreC [Tenuibacillus multivorans]GEL77453.1 cell shape-determining protein MreC [Tenuibacillus multivorans]SDN22040.1 rod shape-determining protein MreC [Tenuibacillus multivorans]
MPSFLRKRKLIVFFTTIILLVAIIGYSLRADEQSNIAVQFIQDTVGLFQNIVYQPVNFIIDLTDNIQDIRDVYSQNEVLKEQLQDYKSLAFQVNELEKENEELRTITEMDKAISDYSPIKATVISRSPEQWFNQVKINKGRQHGIEPNMAVSTAEGMIGKVIGASQLTSTVQLLTGFDVDNRISVVVDGHEDIFGLIEGYDEESETLLFRELTDSGDLEEGQTIISSGMGGVFPRGLLIGEVSSVELDQYGLTKIAHVKPAADLLNINHVMVINRDIYSPVLDDQDQLEEES